MVKSVAAPQAKGKSAEDKIFGANNRAVALTEKLGADKVINGTVGSMLDEDGNLIMLDVVQKAYKALTPKEIVAYAPIQGYPDYLEAAIDQCFGESRPEGYIRACATSGGSGVLHHVIHNYSEWGDEVLTSDWHWGAYGSMCNDNGRKLREFELLTPDGHFNMESFKANVSDMVAKQYNTVIIMNSPANNPTGYGLSDSEWDEVLAFLKDVVKGKDKNIIFVSDVAYLDYSGEKHECRKFFKKFGNMPDNVLIVVAYTCSKGFTMYGQRMGAMICVTVALTYGVAQTQKVVTLSPPEDYSLADGVATIKFSQISDGHLHRFEYRAKDGTSMRFIIIKKNGGAYGVGLDACDNCGDAGYYEKDGKIICKKCDVAINLATIGFKGGCNPIPFDYQVKPGKIVIQTSTLDALSSHFQ